MTPSRAPIAPADAVERYLARIDAHLVRLTEGHDPFGHLFAIERLTRSARAEWSETQRQHAAGREKA
jgi:hypothetical protein